MAKLFKPKKVVKKVEKPKGVEPKVEIKPEPIVVEPKVEPEVKPKVEPVEHLIVRGVHKYRRVVVSHPNGDTTTKLEMVV